MKLEVKGLSSVYTNVAQFTSSGLLGLFTNDVIILAFGGLSNYESWWRVGGYGRPLVFNCFSSIFFLLHHRFMLFIHSIFFHSFILKFIEVFVHNSSFSAHLELKQVFFMCEFPDATDWWWSAGGRLACCNERYKMEKNGRTDCDVNT